jgi:NAD(P)-dependent dehydrogenase (short-subunit alcohol dehydrogenase family)
MNGYPRYADYNAAKAGVIELTRTMALELAPTIRVIAVCPGYVWTAMQEAEYTPEMKSGGGREDSAPPPRDARRDRRSVRLPRFRRGSLTSRDNPVIIGRRRNRRGSREPMSSTAGGSGSVSGPGERSGTIAARTARH